MPDRRRHLIFAGIAGMAGVLLGLNETRYHGYVVGYSIVAILILCSLIGVVSGVLLVSRRCRSFWVSGLIGAITLFVSFYATIVAASAAGAWDQPMVSLGSDVQSNIVVLFREDATGDSIYEFTTKVVATPHPGGGSRHLSGMQSLLHVRVGSHEGYAIGLRSDITAAQRRYIDQRIESSPIVWRTLENVAPDNIVLPEEASAN